jgi:hypothetical protein
MRKAVRATRKFCDIVRNYHKNDTELFPAKVMPFRADIKYS